MAININQFERIINGKGENYSEDYEVWISFMELMGDDGTIYEVIKRAVDAIKQSRRIQLIKQLKIFTTSLVNAMIMAQ